MSKRNRHRGQRHGPRPPNPAAPAPRFSEDRPPQPQGWQRELQVLLATGQHAERITRAALQKNGTQAYPSADNLFDRIHEVISFYGIMVERCVAVRLALELASTEMMKHAITQTEHYLDCENVHDLEEARHYFKHLLPAKDFSWPADGVPFAGPYSSRREY